MGEEQTLSKAHCVHLSLRFCAVLAALPTAARKRSLLRVLLHYRCPFADGFLESSWFFCLHAPDVRQYIYRVNPRGERARCLKSMRTLSRPPMLLPPPLLLFCWYCCLCHSRRRHISQGRRRAVVPKPQRDLPRRYEVDHLQKHGGQQLHGRVSRHRTLFCRFRKPPRIEGGLGRQATPPSP